MDKQTSPLQNPRYRAVLFDLDGTLTCSHPGILGSVKLSLQEMGLPVPPPETLRKFIGPPLAYSYTTFCGMTQEQAEEGIRRYRSHYNRDGIFRWTVYDGIFELMRELGEKHQIPWQLKSGISGGNDASAVQRTKEGVRVAAISVAVRYLHAPSSVACVQDFDHMHALARKWIEAVACL